MAHCSTMLDEHGKEIEVITLTSSDEEDDYGPPPAAAAAPARAATPTQLAEPSDGGEGEEQAGDDGDSGGPTAPAAAAAAAPPPPPAARAPKTKSRRRRGGGIKRRREQEEDDEPPQQRGRPASGLASPRSGAGPSRPLSPGGGHQRSLNEFFPVVRVPKAPLLPKEAPEEAVAGPSSLPAAPAPAPPPAAPIAPASGPELPNSFSSPAVASTFQVAEDILGALMGDSDGGGGDSVAEVLAGLLRRFRGEVPLNAAIPQDMFDERKQELIDEMMGSHLAAELRAAKEALLAKEEEVSELQRDLRAARAELEKFRANAAQPGELERQLAAVRAELEQERTRRVAGLKALNDALLESRQDVRASGKREQELQQEVAALREVLLEKEEAEKARAVAASGSCGVSTPSDAVAEGPCAEEEDEEEESEDEEEEEEDAAAADGAQAAPQRLHAEQLPKGVITQAVLNIRDLIAHVRVIVEQTRDQHALAERPERLKARLEEFKKLLNEGKMVMVEPNCWAEGADPDKRWPGFTYSPRSYWAGAEVPAMTPQLNKRLNAAGLTRMTAGLRKVLSGSVAYPMVITRSLIDGGKGWGLRALEPIPAGACIIAYHGEYMSIKEAKAMEKTLEEDCKKSCFSFDLDACAPRAAALTPAQKDTLGAETESGLLFKVYNETCVLDSRHRGNASRFFNHSCVPNCITRELDVAHGPTMTMQFALRDIKAGEELTLDYVQGWSKKKLRNALEAYKKGISHQKCSCGHRKCRGWCF